MLLDRIPKGPADGPQIEALLDRAFGPDRRNKTSYRYRDGIAAAGRAVLGRPGGRGVLVGAIRYWPIRLGTAAGPAARAAGDRARERQGQGIGRALTEASLARAEALGWRLVFLVGDPAYYARYGFAVAPANIVMPGESPARLQYPDPGRRRAAGRGRHPAARTRRRARRAAARARRAAPCSRPCRAPAPAAARPWRAATPGVGDDLGQRPDQGADGEHDRPALRQAAQGLPLDPQPELLAGVLGREVEERLARLRME